MKTPWIAVALLGIAGCGHQRMVGAAAAEYRDASAAIYSAAAVPLVPKPLPSNLGVPWDEASADAKRVLVVINENSPESMDIGQLYVKQRRIPHDNVMFIAMSSEDDCQAAEFHQKLEGPVQKKVHSMSPRPDFIVLTKGIPIRFREWNTMSTDAGIAAMDLSFTPMMKLEEAQIRRSLNPYYGRNEAVSSAKYGFYLVTRLDGSTADDAKKLVTNSLAAKAVKGPWLIDIDPGRATRGGYAEMHQTMVRAVKVLKDKGLETEVDETDLFTAGSKPCIGYVSWGSNDGHYLLSNYRKIRFLPGAIAETFVSTSARTFKPVTSGQSVISDLIASGITGVKGYVDEPYTLALAHPDILFDRYSSGYTLAESFYMASPMLKWKDIVVGDPICRPFPRK